VTGVTATAVSQNYGVVSGVLIMPTDLRVASERKRKAAQAQAQTEVTILSIFVIVSLVMLMFLFVDQSFSKAAVELLGQF
jgi:hypothetical protein